MLISATVATLKGFSVLNMAREVLSVESRLSIIGDGAIGLAAGYLLVGNVDKLRIFANSSNHSNRANSKSEKLPKFIEMVGRGEESTLEFLTADFAPATHNMRDAVKGASGLVITAPVTEYGAIIQKLKSDFTASQAILLVNAPLGAGLQFAEQLRLAKVENQLNILELGSLFDYAEIEGDTLRIYGARQKISVCGNNRNQTRRALTTTTGLSRSLVPASNLLERGLTDVERLIRPTLLLFGLLGGRSFDLSDLSQVVNPQLTTLIRSLEAEVKEVCQAYRLSVRGFLETMTELSAVSWNEVDCLDQALIAVAPTLLSQARAEGKGLETNDIAFSVLKKDVIETLVVVSLFARIARVQVPVLDSIIAMAGVICRCDFNKSGRSLTDLGLFSLDLGEIMEVVNA